MTNPAMKMFDNEPNNGSYVVDGNVMTVNGTLQLTFVLGIVLFAAAAYVWSRFTLGYTDIANMLMKGGLIVGCVLALIISFTRIKYLVPIYAACEGLALGGLSAIFEAQYPGIVVQAVGGTFAAFFSMLILYRLGIIKCTDKFRSIIFISTASIAVIYLVDLIGRIFHYSVPVINSSSDLGIGFTAVVVVIAALNLILDFDFIEQGANKMLPKDYEWYGAFGLMVTLVWLYVEILKLISKARSRN